MYYNYPPFPYQNNVPMNGPDDRYQPYQGYPCPYNVGASAYDSDYPDQTHYPYMPDSYTEYDSRQEDHEDDIPIMDYGPEPLAVNIEEVTKQNDTFRTTLWTGDHLQLTLMSIKVGEDIGFEIHEAVDQFIRIGEGQGIVLMGDRKDEMDFKAEVYDDFAFIIPAGKWHNLINTGNKPLKVYSIYAPPQHPHGTVHKTKEAAAGHEE